MVSALTYEICLLGLMFLCLKHTFNCLRIIFLEHSSPPATFQSLSLMAKIVNRFLSSVVVKTSFQTEYNCLDHSHALNLLNHVFGCSYSPLCSSTVSLRYPWRKKMVEQLWCHFSRVKKLFPGRYFLVSCSWWISAVPVMSCDTFWSFVRNIFIRFALNHIKGKRWSIMVWKLSFLVK